MRYDVFISYSHRADVLVAPALQSALKRFARRWPWWPALRVFRDETDLSVSPNLWKTIESALDKAEFFLLLCSPGASESKWVGKEVSFWLEKKSAETLLFALTSGEIVWDDTHADFDWSSTRSLPA